NVSRLHQPREFGGGDARQYRQRDARADAGHLLQVAEQRAFVIAQETVQRDGVFLVRVVGEQDHFLADVRQVVQRGHRHFQLVADAAHFDQHPRRPLGDQRAAQTADHRRRLHAASAMPVRASLARRCACVMAIASASAASACNGSRTFNRIPTMCCTCSLPAWPLPTTACLMALGAYSLTGNPHPTAAQIAAPRAYPSFNAESAFFAMNTRSIAASAGACASMMAESSS